MGETKIKELEEKINLLSAEIKGYKTAFDTVWSYINSRYECEDFEDLEDEFNICTNCTSFHIDIKDAYLCCAEEKAYEHHIYYCPECLLKYDTDYETTVECCGIEYTYGETIKYPENTDEQ